MEIENWFLHFVFGLLILGGGIWLEKRRDKKEKGWYFGGYLNFQFRVLYWGLILGGQILFWQGIMILISINWLSIIGLYVATFGASFLLKSFNAYNEASWYNRKIRNKGLSIVLLVLGVFLIFIGWK
ncbi:hypothetical protein JYB64_19030 [Algoriphagus aestuarii]|nr:hypothetical protein [Algoriphagus aestuarii]